MAVRVLQADAFGADLEGDEQMAAGARTRWNSANVKGSSSIGVCTVEYRTRAPAREPSARSRSVIVPTEKRRCGCSPRATATIPGDRSIPNASSPSFSRWTVIRPGPHPRSATAPPPPARTRSANAAGIARSSGPPNWSLSSSA
jgi:hypothetical protein